MCVCVCVSAHVVVRLKVVPDEKEVIVERVIIEENDVRACAYVCVCVRVYACVVV